jgi:hypothetical protein
MAYFLSNYRCLGGAFDLGCAYSTADRLHVDQMIHKVRTGTISTESISFFTVTL